MDYSVVDISNTLLCLPEFLMEMSQTSCEIVFVSSLRMDTQRPHTSLIRGNKNVRSGTKCLTAPSSLTCLSDRALSGAKRYGRYLFADSGGYDSVISFGWVRMCVCVWCVQVGVCVCVRARTHTLAC